MIESIIIIGVGLLGAKEAATYASDKMNLCLYIRNPFQKPTRWTMGNRSGEATQEDVAENLR